MYVNVATDLRSLWFCRVKNMIYCHSSGWKMKILNTFTCKTTLLFGAIEQITETDLVIDLYKCTIRAKCECA